MYVAFVLCLGCRKPIDEAFESVTRDERDRAWHTSPCWVEREGAQDRDVNPNADIATYSPALSAVDWLGRRRKARR